MSAPDVVRFYFSFRSPYSWFAVHRIESVLEGLPVRLEWFPVFPPKDPAAMPNNPTNVPAKARYVLQDSQRFAALYGLEFHAPDPLDTEWSKPHCSFLYAQAQGRGSAFAQETYAARFSRVEDVGDESVLADIARRVGLDPEKVVAAAEDPAITERLGAGFRSFLDDQAFGVPTFAHRDQLYFGNDRIEWLADAIREAA